MFSLRFDHNIYDTAKKRRKKKNSNMRISDIYVPFHFIESFLFHEV